MGINLSAAVFAHPPIQTESQMNDSEVNPMKTGLMFVPLGRATMSPGCLFTPSECVDHVERCKGASDRRVHIRLFALSTLGRSAFRLLERFGQVAQRQEPSST